jgi:cytochrome P450
MNVILRMTFSAQIGDDAPAIEQAVRTAMTVANQELYWPASWPDWAPWKRAKRQALATLDGLIQRHLNARLAQREENWPEDMLSRLLKLHRQAPQAWPLKAVRDECITAFLAGHETTAATLSWWSWCMAAHPEVQDKAAAEVNRVLQGRIPNAEDMAELSYLTQTLEETLRLYPTAPVLNTRRAVRPLTLGPWRFPARTLFLIPIQLMHHDPRWFPEPLAFRPERFERDAANHPRGAYLPFGAGPRVCLGQHLAMTELKVVAACLLQRFRLSAPAGSAEPKPVFHISLRPDRPLRLSLAPDTTAS